MSTPCTSHDEYIIPISGTSESTPHAIYGDDTTQCNTVRIGGGGVNN